MKWVIPVIIGILIIGFLITPVTTLAEEEKYYIVNVYNRANFSITGFVAEIDLDPGTMPDVQDLINNIDTMYITDSAGRCLWYYVEAFDPATKHTKLYVKTGTIDANSVYTIYIRYGKYNACPGYNNPNEVFLVFDDFTYGMKGIWSIEGSGNITYHDEYIELSTDGSEFYIITPLNKSYEGIKVIAYIQDLLTNGDAGAQLVLENITQGVLNYAYFVELNSVDEFKIARYDKHTLNYTGYLWLPLDPNKVYRITIEKSDEIFTGFVDDRGIYGIDGTYTISSVVLGFYKGNEQPDTIRIYKVMVFPYIEPEPLVVYPVEPVIIRELAIPEITKFPVQSQYQMDALIGLLMLAVVFPLTIYLTFERNYRLLFAVGIGIIIVSIALLVARSAIPTEAVYQNGVLEYKYEVNPLARIYIAPFVLGLLMVSISMLMMVKYAFRPRRW